MRVVLLIAIFIGVTIGIGWPQSPPIADIAAPPASAPPPPSSSNTPRRTVVARSPSGHFLVDGEVNGQKVRFVVDTGASTVALTIADAHRIGLPFDPARFAVVASGASGAVRGEIIELGSVALDG
ncbi:MAG: family clan aspartic protease [Sphingomonas bacterium]|nr:family clan aspartic protease [Sphingomonas bacterium]